MTSGRRVAAAAAALGVLVLAGCSDDATEPEDPEGTASRPAADFDTEVVAADGVLRATYTLTNRSGGELLVVNGIPSAVGAGVSYTSDDAYVTGQDDGRVQVAQRAFAWPDRTTKDWAQAPRVGVTSLADGRSVSATVELPLPLERSQPFGDDLGYGEISLPDPAESAVFCLGVLPTPYDQAIGLSTDDDVTTIAHGNAANAGQHLFCSDPVDL